MAITEPGFISIEGIDVTDLAGFTVASWPRTHQPAHLRRHDGPAELVEVGNRLGGYSAGIERKIKLLELEGVKVEGDLVLPRHLGLL